MLQVNVAADEDFTGEDAWDMAPASEVYDPFFTGFSDEHLEGWLRDRDHVALVRAEMDGWCLLLLSDSLTGARFRLTCDSLVCQGSRGSGGC